MKSLNQGKLPALKPYKCSETTYNGIVERTPEISKRKSNLLLRAVPLGWWSLMSIDWRKIDLTLISRNAHKTGRNILMGSIMEPVAVPRPRSAL